MSEAFHRSFGGCQAQVTAKSVVEGKDMDFETLFAKTPATIDEIRARVAYRA